MIYSNIESSKIYGGRVSMMDVASKETGDLTITDEIKGNDEIAILDRQLLTQEAAHPIKGILKLKRIIV